MKRRTPHSDRSVRSLVQLEASASTSRSLNLVAVWKRHGSDAEYWGSPFFRNPVLNRCMVIKHRLRWHEGDGLPTPRTTATKVVLPLDISDLRLGAQSFFVGERGSERFMDGLWRRPTERDLDLALLQQLDNLPSFDPFLMRERLAMAGYRPSRCYFELSPADAARMMDFVRGEVEPLVGISFAAGSALNGKISKLANKIMANAGDAELDPLRESMGMDRPTFEEGIFCWKGFIYYKWSLAQMRAEVAPVLTEISQVRPRGWTNEHIVAINLLRAKLIRGVNLASDKVRGSLDIYEAAYAELTRLGRPTAFRDFLLEAPRLFQELGERLGALQHMVSFWRFRFPPGRSVALAAEDMIDLLADFQLSLGIDEATPAEHPVYLPIRN